MTDATHSHTFECNGDPKCSNAPTQVHKGSGATPSATSATATEK